MQPAFSAALLTVSKTWTQPKCPPTEEQIRKRGVYTHTHTVGHCSAINKNEIMPSAATWMHPEIIIPSEVSQTETNICHHFYVESKNMPQGVHLSQCECGGSTYSLLHTVK